MKFGAIPLSKSVSFKLKQRDISIREQALELETQFSVGYTAEINSLLIYSLVKAQFEYATELDKNYGFYLGANLGGLWRFDMGLLSETITGQTQINYQFLQHISGEDGDVKKLNMGLQFNLIKDQALRLEYNVISYETFDVDEIRLSYLIYF